MAVLNSLINKSIKKMAMFKAINTINNDSPKNCLISCCLPAPTTFLMATSFVRVIYFAVDRFIKLMHAISSINRERTENKIIPIIPFVSPYKYTFLSGVRNCLVSISVSKRPLKKSGNCLLIFCQELLSRSKRYV
ncbi:hypothetical protein ES705_41079 [subsurface metagenome]